MATMFGRFEIQSELSKSETALIYKATDTETNQIVALKTQSLEPLGETAQSVCRHADRRRREHARPCQPEHRAPLRRRRNRRPVLRGHGVHPGQQHRHHVGAQRRLLDLGPARHYAPGLRGPGACGRRRASSTTRWNPPKSWCSGTGWSRLLGYGISNMGLIEAETGRGLGRLMPYCSPEQDSRRSHRCSFEPVYLGRDPLRDGCWPQGVRRRGSRRPRDPDTKRNAPQPHRP